jgi:predicted phosphodiesterase
VHNLSLLFPKLYAISDLHLRYQQNREALAALPAFPNDWLILAGDLGETEAQLRQVFQTTTERFARVLWVPGNHELWTMPEGETALDQAQGVARYEALVALARSFNVLTPEDPFPVWPEMVLGKPCTIALLFALYDFSFAPVPAEAVADWAAQELIFAQDDRLLSPAPFASVAEWCHARVATSEQRLGAIPESHTTVLVNHYPLHRDHVILPRVPRYAPWCGTLKTKGWAERYRAAAVVSGHLHVRSTRWEQGVLYQEVSWGYPRDRRAKADAPGHAMQDYLQQVLPLPEAPKTTSVMQSVFSKGHPR